MQGRPLTLIQIYSGQSKNWKRHFQGAWDIFRRFQSQKPWEDSDFAQASFQSLYIISIVGATAQSDDFEQYKHAETFQTPQTAQAMSSLAGEREDKESIS